jgi:hypothetical protein
MYWTAQLLPCIVVPCAVRGMAACRSSRRQRKSALVKAKPSPRRGRSSRREPPRVGMRTTSPRCPCSAGPNRSWPTCETELRGAQASKGRPVLGASRGNGFSSHPFQRSRVGGGGPSHPHHQDQHTKARQGPDLWYIVSPLSRLPHAFHSALPLLFRIPAAEFESTSDSRNTFNNKTKNLGPLGHHQPPPNQQHHQPRRPSPPPPPPPPPCRTSPVSPSSSRRTRVRTANAAEHFMSLRRDRG